MYKTDVFKNDSSENFDWETYFSLENSDVVIKQVDFGRIIFKLREHLKEDKFLMTFVLSKLMRCLLEGIRLKNPKILELGAATGFLTRWLISRHGGKGVLVDKSNASLKAYNEMKDSIKKHITYITKDLFTLSLDEKFDLVCSFGLIEHFVDKESILDAHKRFVASNGIIVILVPLDSPLTRAFLEVHPELNLGYRELLSEKELKRILKQNGLEILKIQKSWGYAYDFVGGICRIAQGGGK